MDGDAIIYAVWAVLLAGILVSLGLTYRSHWLRTRRARLMEVFNGYFRGDIPPNELGRRTGQIVTRQFMGSAEFYSLAVTAFQDAIDAGVADQSRSEERQAKLLRLLAALKNQFGLTDRYQIEAWRPGRE
jgi:hypothetical protein